MVRMHVWIEARASKQGRDGFIFFLFSLLFLDWNPSHWCGRSCCLVCGGWLDLTLRIPPYYRRRAHTPYYAHLIEFNRKFLYYGFEIASSFGVSRLAPAAATAGLALFWFLPSWMLGLLYCQHVHSVFLGTRG